MTVRSEGYSVRAVTRLTGVNEHTLRAWERRYQAVVPDRTQTGRRCYSEVQVQRIKQLMALVRRGHAISNIAGWPDDKLDSTIAEYDPTDVHLSPDAEFEERELIRETLRVATSSVEHFEMGRLQKQLQKARYSLSGLSFAVKFAAPLARIVGDMVQSGRMSVAQEHIITALLKAHLLNLMADMNRGGEEGRKAVMLATMEGDHHELGILIGAVILAGSGYEPVFVGANIPAVPLAEAASAWRVHAVLLGVTALAEVSLPASRVAYMVTLGQHLREGTEIWIGGQLPGYQAETHKMREFTSFDHLQRRLAERV